MIIDESITSKASLKVFNDLENKFNKKYNFIYDYSKSVYKGNKQNMDIYCRKHNITFSQSPYHHLKGFGCKECKKENKRRQKMTQAEFIDLVKPLFTQYDFTKTEYINSQSKILVICKKHGEFEISPSRLFRGSTCPICAKERVIEANTTSFNTFVLLANETHNSKYDYIESSYTKVRNSVEAICSLHGKFKTNAFEHLKGQGNCPECNRIERVERKSLDYPIFMERAKTKFGDTFTYLEETYTCITKQMTIICKEHGEFRMTPEVHLRSPTGCPECSKKL